MGSDDILYDNSLFKLYRKVMKATDSQINENFKRKMYGVNRDI